MKDALAYEWIRLRTLRSTWWLTGLTAFFGIGISTAFAYGLHHDYTHQGGTDEDPFGLGALLVTQLAATGEVPSIVCFLLAVVGVFAWGHEYRHGMIRASLTALNSRTRLWVAKFLVIGVWVAVVSFVTMVLSGVIGTLFLHDYVEVLSARTWGVIGRQVGYGVLFAWIAMAFTAITRSQAFALVAVFLWPLLVENLISLFFYLVPGLRDHADVLRFLPFSAGGRMVAVLREADSTFGDPLSALGGFVVFGGVTAVLMAVSLLMFRSRDA